MFRLRNKIRLSGFRRDFSTPGKPRVFPSEEVRHALEAKMPVVALESTIITHGMPYPKNVECALGVEKIIRDAGAIPATIAILKGRLTVGLSRREIETIGDVKSNPSIKTSRRDFPFVLGNRLNGGTTVSGTLIACSLAGIPVFATGGIGGVHRMGETTMDVSADLVEMGRTPVAVVSSGVKSILDIPKTLEFLETQGVFVSTYGETKHFPAFYTRDSGCLSPYNTSTPAEAARIVNACREAGLRSGMLFAVPVPEAHSLNPEEMKGAIDEALRIAHTNGISGKEITPFLLAHLAQATAGRSLETNVALVQNNAKVAAEIAVALSEIDKGGRKGGISDGNPLVVIGGSVLDRCVTTESAEIKLDGSVHDGRITESAGGVGRNICDALVKLSRPPVFITALGNDESGNLLAASLARTGSTVHRIPDARTAQCVVVLDGNGDCRFLVGDMDIHTRITPAFVKANTDAIAAAPLIVLDGNPPRETMETVLELAGEHRVPVFFEPTDQPIAAKPFQTTNWNSIKYITPNLNELITIAKHFDITDIPNTSEISDISSLAEKVADYIDNVIVTIGSKGLIIARKNSAKDPLYKYKPGERIQIRHYPARKAERLVNVSGAGDCFTAGLITAMLKGLNEETCVNVGIAGAIRALGSASAVPRALFGEDDEAWRKGAEYITIK